MKNHNKSDKPYGKQGKTEVKFGRYYSFQIVNDPLAVDKESILNPPIELP